jgi:hypothetical protein
MSLTRIQTGLAAYEISTRGFLATREGRLPAWTAYAAAAGSALAMTGQAEATIVYSGLQNVTIERTASGTFSSTKTLRLPNDSSGLSVARIFLGKGSTAGMGWLLSPALSNPDVPIFPIVSALDSAAGIGMLKKFSSGETIPVGGSLAGLALGLSAGGGFTPTWTNGVTAFAGLVLNGTIAGGAQGPLTGWIRLRFDIDPKLIDDGFPNRITAIDWAFRTAPGNGALVADQTVEPTPEPATLSLLALGACGVAAMRRRRERATAP